MNSNLIPEIRADVNGKLVTRHVKQESGSGKSMQNVPAPLLKMEQVDVRNELIKEMDAHLPNQIRKTDFADYVRQIPIGYAEALYEGLQSSGDGVLINRITLKANLIGAGIVMGLSADFMKDVMVPQEEISKDKGMTNTVNLFNQVYEDNFSKKKKTPDDYNFKKALPAYQTAVIVEALGSTEGTVSNFETRDHYAVAEENLDSLKRNIRPLMLAGHELWQLGKFMDTYQAVEISHLIDEYPGTEDVIVSFLKQRGRCDVNEVRSLIEGGAVSLASGIL